MLQQVGRSQPRPRAWRVAAWALVLMAAGGLAWTWFRRPAEAKGAGRVSVPARTAAVPGTLVVPVVRPDGTPGEPLVLVPARPGQAPAPAPPGPPAANPAVPLPAAVSVRTNEVIPASPAQPPRPAGPSRPPSPYEAILPGFEERVLAVQAGLARRAISSGPLDGVLGSQTRAALRAFQEAEGLPVTGILDGGTAERLGTNHLVFTNYVITAEDAARLLPIGSTWVAKSQQPRLDYETLLELVAERSLTNPKLVRAFNPEVDWSRAGPGTSIRLLAVEVDPPPARAALVRIHTAGRYLQAFAEGGRLLAHFPCSIAARVEKRPVGETLSIVAVAPQPNYTFDPAVFPESAEARQLGSKKLILPPGPNNPVGTVWFSLDKPGYGIHGTPRPEEVGRTESHGCFRLANWNAEYLLKLAGVGTQVQVEP